MTTACLGGCNKLSPTVKREWGGCTVGTLFYAPLFPPEHNFHCNFYTYSYTTSKLLRLPLTYGVIGGITYRGLCVRWWLFFYRLNKHFQGLRCVLQILHAFLRCVHNKPQTRIWTAYRFTRVCVLSCSWRPDCNSYRLTQRITHVSLRYVDWGLARPNISCFVCSNRTPDHFPWWYSLLGGGGASTLNQNSTVDRTNRHTLVCLKAGASRVQFAFGVNLIWPTYRRRIWDTRLLWLSPVWTAVNASKAALRVMDSSQY